VTPLAAALAARIRRDGPLRYAELVEAALYDAGHGFYVTGGHAGRRGDFLTSAEVGPLFGAVLARALAAHWDGLGRPATYTVVEVGAGPGTLARAVLAAADGAWREALRYVTVEQSARQRERHPHGVEARETLPAGGLVGAVVANELLDNLPFDLVEARDGTWREVLVGVDHGGALVEQLGAPVEDPRLPDVATVADGARAPLQDAAAAFLRSALATLRSGMVLVFDYAAPASDLLARPWTEWVRTYRAHERGGHPLDMPGSQDITCEVDLDQLRRVAEPAEITTQAAFLRAHGLDELVAEGRAAWHAGAGIGDLAALKARSRVREAEALCSADGLGAFAVLRWVR
jgi:SAM-dependent MidA family methyltransferase